MFNIRKNKKGFTLVELIVVIAILAILAGTAAGIGVTLINKNTNKSAQSEVNLLVDDFKQFILEKESDGWSYNPEEASATAADNTPAGIIGDLLDGFKASLDLDSKQKDKIEKPSDGWPATDQTDKTKLPKAGEHKFYVYYEPVPASGEDPDATDYKPASFTVTFKCAAKGKYNGEDVIFATYTYATSIG